MKTNKLLGNKKSPITTMRLLMFGSKQLDGGLPNAAIFPVSFPPVNTTLYSYAQQWITYYRSPIRCESIGLIAPEYHQSISIVTVIKGLTPRTGRQSKRNRQDMGTPITALFTVQERAVEPFKKSFINKLSTGLSTWK